MRRPSIIARVALFVIAYPSLVLMGCRTRLEESVEASPCPPPPGCHVAGHFDGAAGRCVYPEAPAGTACDDEDACTRDDVCRAGTCVGVPIGMDGVTHCLPWRAGWDDKTKPLAFTRSFVTWSVPAGTRDLRIHYHLVSGAAGTRHVIGVANFPPDGKCIARLGQFQLDSPCVTWIREGIEVVNAVQIDSGSIALDESGNGDADLAYRDIDPGVYGLEFAVRAADFGQGRCPDCDVIYQAPGPYSQSVVIHF
jgi:hypothetical protein